MRYSAVSVAVLLCASMVAGVYSGLSYHAESDPGGHLAAMIEAVPIPEYSGGYGYDATTATMHDHNGFAYSYLPDGIIQLSLPWGYVTYFSFGLTGSYLGVPQTVSALDYTWTWDAQATERYNETGVSQGYDYTFTAENAETLDWSIELAFSATVGDHMKVTHTVTNGYPEALTGVEFWYLFDLTHTPNPYVQTSLGTYYPPLYSELPESVSWVRLSNQFQFNWRDADYPNGHAYLGDGSVVGVDVDILGISLELGDIGSGDSRVIDPYFSGVEKTWNAAASSYSGIAASWDPVGVPETGDNVTFDATSVFNCNWNTSVTLGNFSMAVGYSGIVTMATGFGVADYLQQAGTFIGSATQWLTVSSNFTQSGGLFTDNVLNIQMLGDGKILSRISTQMLRTIWASGNIQVLRTDGLYLYVANYIIDVGKTMTIPTGKIATLYGVSSLVNNGEIAGPGIFQVFMITVDLSLEFGVISAPTVISTLGTATDNRILTLLANTDFGSSLTINSDHATYTTTLNGDGYDLTVAASLIIGTRGILEAGESDITVGTSWTSTDGTYEHGNNTVEFTGTGTLAMASTDSFFNITIADTATITMNTDTYVDLRATILGTMAGTGDFIEPEPEFTSTPETSLRVDEIWEYTPTQTYWDTLGYDSLPGWMVFDSETQTFKAIPNATGFYSVSLTLEWNDMTTYQNFTVLVYYPAVSEDSNQWMSLVIALALGFGFAFVGVVRVIPVMSLLSGLVWLYGAVVLYARIDIGWAAISIGMGLSLLIAGGMQYVGSDQNRQK